MVETENLHCVSKNSPFYFGDNFPKCKIIQIVFGRNVAERIWNKSTIEFLKIFIGYASLMYIVK